MRKQEKKLSERQKRKLMAHCVELAYLRVPPLSQTAIAQELHIDASYVSRLLKQARESGMLKIELDLPKDEELQLELIRRFRLRDAIVVPVFANVLPEDEVERSRFLNQLLGRESAKYLEEPNSPLQNGMRIGISCGVTLLEMIMALTPRHFKNLTISPLTVEGIPELAHQAPSTLVGLLQAKFPEGAYAYGPQFLQDSAFTKREALKDTYKEVFHIIEKMSEKLDLAIVGIGEINTQKEDMAFTVILNKAGVTLKDIKKFAIVGEINNRPYDGEGRDRYEDIKNLSRSTCAMDLDFLRRMAIDKPVLAITGGAKKIDAIRVALETRYVNILITDFLTASALLGKQPN